MSMPRRRGSVAKTERAYPLVGQASGEAHSPVLGNRDSSVNRRDSWDSLLQRWILKRDRGLGVLSPNGKLQGRLVSGGSEGVPRVSEIVNLMLADGGNEVAILVASDGGQTSRLDIESQDTVIASQPETRHGARGDGARRESEVGTEDRPVDDHRLNMGVYGIHRNHIADGLSRRGDGHINADPMTRQIDERPPLLPRLMTASVWIRP